MRNFLTIALLVFSVSLLAQNKKNINIEDFDGIQLKIGATVYVTQGNSYEVILEGSESAIDEVEIKVRSGELVIESRRNSSWRFWSRSSSKLRVYVTVKELNSVSVSSSGDIIGKNLIKADDFRARISGSGDIEMEIDAKTVNSGISGSGNIELSGSADSGKLSISGSGKLLAEDLTVGDFRVSISGSGKGSITVNGELNVIISGSGSVYYGGRPTGVNSSVSGSGKVRRIN